MFIRTLLTWFGRLLCWSMMKVEVTGRSNLPRQGPLLISSNHFSLLEPILIGLYLGITPAFFASADLLAHPLSRIVLNAFQPIIVKRGQVDRQALRKAKALLDAGGMLVIFPEGGIDPAVRDMPAEEALAMPFDRRTSRGSAQLIEARNGTALLALQSGAPILPIAFLHTEKVIPNFRRWRRTKVFMSIGQPLGPFVAPADNRGPNRRKRLDLITRKIMLAIAALLPPENRGPYKLPANS